MYLGSLFHLMSLPSSSKIRDKDPLSEQNTNENDGRSKQQQPKNRVNVNTACQLRVANTEKIRRQLWDAHDFKYEDDHPPEHLLGDGDGNLGQESDEEENLDSDGNNTRSSSWILKNSTKKLTCPHYRQLSSYRTAQMARTSFVASQDTIDCCKVGGEKTKLGTHDIEDLVSFGVNPYLHYVSLYRHDSEGSFGIDVKNDCRIRTIRQGSPAEYCGQLQPGDMILAVNGKKVSSLKEVEDRIKSTTTDLLELSVVRGAGIRSLKSTNSNAEEDNEEVLVTLVRQLGEKSWGMTLESGSDGCRVNALKDGRNGNLKKGDVIIRVNSKDVQGFGFQDVVKEISGALGNTLQLGLRRTMTTVQITAGSDSGRGEEQNRYSPHSPCPYYISRGMYLYGLQRTWPTICSSIHLHVCFKPST
jgi:PDZ domain